MRLPCAIAFASLTAFAFTAVSAQRAPRPDDQAWIFTDTELGDPTGLIVGTAPILVFPTGDGFRNVSAGVGTHLFVGTHFPPFDELRLGGWVSSHGDDLTDGRSEVLSLYLETWFARDLGSWQVRAAPRFLWAREFRALYTTGDSGFGLGAALGARIPLSSRFALEPGFGLTHATFSSMPGTERQSPDISDNRVVNWIWELRAGLAWRVR
jgi:hypothetical protein